MDEEVATTKYLYQVLGVCEDAETEENAVIYKALYPDSNGNYKIYSRNVNEFLSKVDKIKYPNIEREYRFQQI